MSDASVSGEDEILEMFFDEGFVPHAFVDILLSNAANKDISQVQATSSSLLSRFDFYTKNLTKELEMTIQKLEKLSETLPGTWTVKMDAADNDSTSVSAVGSSKLEYYLDTLSSAVRVLEGDMAKINGQLDELDNNYESSSDIVNQLRNLEKIKTRLHKVLNLFNQIKTILTISTATNDKSKTNVKNENGSSITVGEFRDSLQTLEETISQSFTEATNKETVMEKDEDLLKRIDLFTELKPLFQGLHKFNPVYSQFVDGIRKRTNEYLSAKDIGGELN
ncbi:hypothetical protein ZYGR_0AD01920 [Zygosaccharomyces rouxii]|uniref:ZYRO0G10384p n=2 Tax=Zygosaccharomyces rouxii TaxID=4956 RepID=C5E076_ZYGRC|nr:uncharacterized protein ZYRO0G10384g [Zygosaccharomyces rouxii]KAH9202505.1 hypothetical protein LQ764DRAFT_26555 [Zygosaccharomyces rouxii]GAV51009.1 hypothetical protein ZYGR_0AD01920 [Zygosaccharomyces rouxii]CAR29510.1 ZYRO0G10384p [Zygosaccharomyces rouxii]